MPRRYYPRRYVNRDKYSVEQTAGTVALPANETDGAITVVPPADIQGMRKVKHITVQIADRSGANNSVNCTWAIVFVPAGMTPNPLMNNGSPNLYEPNQYVMSCGVFDFNAGPLRVSTPLARNLNSGDQIVLLLKASVSSASATYFDFVVKYAVTLQ